MPRVVVRAGTFQGEADTYLQAADFERFLRELRLFLKELPWNKRNRATIFAGIVCSFNLGELALTPL